MLGALPIAILVVLAVPIIAVISTKPDRAAHEAAIREAVKKRHWISPAVSDGEQFAKLLLLIANEVAQGKEVDHINMLGLRYEDDMFTSRVINPRNDEIVSAGFMNRVTMANRKEAEK